RARGVPLPVGARAPHRWARGVLGDGGVRRDPRPRVAVRLPGGCPRVEVKPPTPQIPAPVWTEFKDLQEWEKYHQERATDDKTSDTLAAIADAIHHMPGGWIVTTTTEKIFNWAQVVDLAGDVRARLLRDRDDGDVRVAVRRGTLRDGPLGVAAQQ